MEYLKRCVFRIGTTEYPVSVSNVNIRPVPRLHGAPSVIEDISGARKTNWKTSQFYLDGTVNWGEHGEDSLWTEYHTFIAALLAWNSASTDTVEICLNQTYDAAFALTIVPTINENLIQFVIEDNIRLRPSDLKFQEAAPRTSLPAWFIS